MPQSPFPCGNSTYCGPVCESLGCAAAQKLTVSLPDQCCPGYCIEGIEVHDLPTKERAEVVARRVTDLIDEGHPHVCDYEEGQRDVRERVEAVQARGAIQPAGTLDSEPYVLVADIRAAIAEDAPAQPSVDDLLGADPDWTGGLSVDDYMDQQRRRP